MKKIKYKEGFIMAGLMLIIVLVYSLAVMKLDVEAIGPEGSRVGFSHLNGALNKLIGYHPFWHRLADILAWASFLTVGLFAAIGMLQLVKRKNLWKVDRQILALGSLFLTVFILYIVFGKIPINYRPIILPDEGALEPSFPSSHTMMACTVFGGVFLVLKDYVRDKKLRKKMRIFCLAMAVLMTLARMLAGIHWFSDIFGGVLIAAFLLTLFDAVLWEIREDRAAGGK